MTKFFNLQDPCYAYMFGFIQTDGHMYDDTRDRGKLTIELQQKDSYILGQFASLIPYHSSRITKKRNTNFKNDHTSSVWVVYDKRLRDRLVELGMKYGKKSDDIKPPSEPFSEVDYYRGIIDGDGSLGITSKGYPFVSLVTKSEHLAKAYIDFLFRLTGNKKTVNRNKRDQVFNIIVYREDAILVAKALYYDECLCLPRKMVKAEEVKSWVRPDSMKKVERRRAWSAEEDEFILNHSIEESVEKLGRSYKSVSLRLWRLRNR